jgi:hypothetical protein
MFLPDMKQMERKKYPHCGLLGYSDVLYSQHGRWTPTFWKNTLLPSSGRSHPNRENWRVI